SDNRCASTAFVQSAIPLVGITGLTGDVTATGPGSVAATLATVNANVGTFGSATACITATANGKGLITGISAATCTPAFSSVTGTASLAQGGLGGSQAGATAGQVPVYPGSGGAAVPTTITPSVIIQSVCDGIGNTDNFVVINAAVQSLASTGGTAILPKGICWMSKGVALPSGVTIKGKGPGATTLTISGAVQAEPL